MRAVRVSVTATRSRIDDDADFGLFQNASLLIRNIGSTSAFIGGADVTASDGFEIEAGAMISVDLAARTAIYAVTSSGSTTLQLLQAG